MGSFRTYTHIKPKTLSLEEALLALGDGAGAGPTSPGEEAGDAPEALHCFQSFRSTPQAESRSRKTGSWSQCRLQCSFKLIPTKKTKNKKIDF